MGSTLKRHEFEGLIYSAGNLTATHSSQSSTFFFTITFLIGGILSGSCTSESRDRAQQYTVTQRKVHRIVAVPMAKLFTINRCEDAFRVVFT